MHDNSSRQSSTDDETDILLVEDNPGDIHLTKEAFKSAEQEIALQTVTNGDDAVNFLQQSSDDNLPDLVSMAESASESRSTRFKGYAALWKGDGDSEDGEESPEWKITTVARRTTNDDSTAMCAVTDLMVSLNEFHYYVTSKRPTPIGFQPADSDHAILDYEHGLEELERQLDLEAEFDPDE